MVETCKQVRVDNWGIFFLSRLQVFFNKTDYCDLTLQFEGNVQLKVHRLVMNACTDYFQLLEQSCEVIDDILLMPADLQADVILPIVNFMYTGMLEFQMSLFEKLYKTAELMNITVLLKLLDAQKQPIPVPKSIVSKVPPTYNLQGKKITPKQDKGLPATLPGRKLPVWKRKSVPSSASTPFSEPRKSTVKDPLTSSYDNTPKPTRFEWPEEDLGSFNLLDSSFDHISYTSKPLFTQEEERASTSNSKTKELNNADMEDIKNYVKEQKLRSDFVDLEEDVDNDFSDEAPPAPSPESTKRKATSTSTLPSKKIRVTINEKENKETRINITGKTTEVDHSKIISEVLKKYPHLVKKNKSIKLKILAKGKTSETPIVIQPIEPKTPLKVAGRITRQSKAFVPQITKVIEAKSTPILDTKPQSNEGPWICKKCSNDNEQVEFVLYYLYRKHMTDVHNEKFDSRMCKYCGHKCTKHNLLMYHQFTKHGIKPPAAYNFPKCNQCPYIALNETLMTKHKLNHTKYHLQCNECKVGFNNDTALKQHSKITGHTGKANRLNYDCQYCTKYFQTSANLFSHIRMAHRDEARRDGIVSIDEDDEEFFEDCPELCEDTTEKVKILSDVSVQEALNIQNQVVTGTNENQTGEELNNVPNLAQSLGLVDIVVLDDNQQYILHSNDQQLVSQQTLTNNPEYILPELTDTHSFVQNQNINQVITTQHNVITQSMLGNSDIASTDELVMVLTDHDYNDENNEMLSNDNSNIVVLYSHPVEGQQNYITTTQGNIMLNSETGMLEIRNSGLQGNQTMVAQPNAVESIESIEMIQREIDSHNPKIDNSANKGLIQTVEYGKCVKQDSQMSIEGGLVNEYVEDIGIIDKEVQEQSQMVLLQQQQQQQQQIAESQEVMEVDEEIDENPGATPLIQEVHSSPVIQEIDSTPLIEEVNSTSLMQEVNSTSLMQEVNSTSLAQEVESTAHNEEGTVLQQQTESTLMLEHQGNESTAHVLQPELACEMMEVDETQTGEIQQELVCYDEIHAIRTQVDEAHQKAVSESLSDVPPELTCELEANEELNSHHGKEYAENEEMEVDGLILKQEIQISKTEVQVFQDEEITGVEVFNQNALDEVTGEVVKLEDANHLGDTMKCELQNTENEVKLVSEEEIDNMNELDATNETTQLETTIKPENTSLTEYKTDVQELTELQNVTHIEDLKDSTNTTMSTDQIDGSLLEESCQLASVEESKEIETTESIVDIASGGIHQELNQEINEDLNQEISHELDEGLKQELNEEISHELHEGINEGVSQEIAKEVSTEILPEMGVEMSRETTETSEQTITEINEDIAETLEETVNESQEETADDTIEETVNEALEETAETGEQNHKAKMSILEDWEDTDSQQSEHGRGNTVNKLINDWDDD